VFTVQGHGTVVTGTMISGTLKVGDEVVVYPKMLSSRVRSIQVYGEPVEAAYAGQRLPQGLIPYEIFCKFLLEQKSNPLWNKIFKSSCIIEMRFILMTQ